MFSTLMPPAIECDTANAHTLWSLLGSLVTDRKEGVTSASACNGNSLHTGPAFALMTQLLALVAAVKSVVARLRTIRYRILASLSTSV